MRLARVDGMARPRQKVDGMEGTRIVLLTIVGDTSGSIVAAADPLQAGVGDYVLVAEGHAARAAIRPSNPESSPLDAAIVAILRPDEVKPTLLD